MSDILYGRSKVPADENHPVTVHGFLFCTHQAKAVPRALVMYPNEAFLEQFRLGNQIKADLSLYITVLLITPGTELFTEEEVEKLLYGTKILLKDKVQSKIFFTEEYFWESSFEYVVQKK